MLILSAETREKRGKRSNILRKNNYLPAIVYGEEIKSLPIKVDYKNFEKVWKAAGEGTIINLKIEKVEDKTKKTKEILVLIREIQKDPISEKILHVDFFQLPMDKEVEVTIPLVFEGEAPAEKELGGVLIKNLHEVKIKGLPKNLISSVKVDVSSLAGFGDWIKVKDLSLPKGLEILANAEEIVALVGKIEEEKIEAVPEKVEPGEVEVVGEEEKIEKEEKGGEEESQKKSQEQLQEKPSPSSK